MTVEAVGTITTEGDENQVTWTKRTRRTKSQNLQSGKT
ncbi:MAG: hypothetical protein DMF61_11930 [Blastocatellia bacterium AA13]|nr:MAG: hypothetical protein DMF61_11930 [Blastocatellia bacterium AA13]